MHYSLSMRLQITDPHPAVVPAYFSVLLLATHHFIPSIPYIITLDSYLVRVYLYFVMRSLS